MDQFYFSPIIQNSDGRSAPHHENKVNETGQIYHGNIITFNETCYHGDIIKFKETVNLALEYMYHHIQRNRLNLLREYHW